MTDMTLFSPFFLEIFLTGEKPKKGVMFVIPVITTKSRAGFIRRPPQPPFRRLGTPGRLHAEACLARGPAGFGVVVFESRA